LIKIQFPSWSLKSVVSDPDSLNPVTDQGIWLNLDPGFAESGSKRLCWQFTYYLHYISVCF